VAGFPGTDFDRRGLVLGWFIIGGWTVATLMSLFTPTLLGAEDARYATLALMSAFTFVHGARRYGLGGIAFYFVLAVVVANVFENMSIATGWPFGRYHHTALMGPKLLHVPLIVGPVFAVAGYLGWVLAGIILGDAQRGPDRGLAIAQPLIAALFTTSWDLCVDPIGGTVRRDWVWADGGGFYGVPWLNFFGWVLTMWIIFQVFALFLALWGRSAANLRGRGYWLQPIAFWVLIALQFPLLAALVPDAQLSDPAGTPWRAAHVFEGMAVVSVFTLLSTALLAFCCVQQARR